MGNPVNTVVVRIIIRFVSAIRIFSSNKFNGNLPHLEWLFFLVIIIACYIYWSTSFHSISILSSWCIGGSLFFVLNNGRNRWYQKMSRLICWIYIIARFLLDLHVSLRLVLHTLAITISIGKRNVLCVHTHTHTQLIRLHVA